MRIRRMITAACVAVAIAGPVAAEQVGPVSAEEVEAFDFRRLQSELMVAALACNDARHRAEYNTFVQRFRPALSENARVLKAFFGRTHGAKAQGKLDDFITRLANDASLASMGDARFCVNALIRFRDINRVVEGQTASAILDRVSLGD